MIYPGVWIAVFRGYGSPYSFTHYVNMLGLGVRTDAYTYSDEPNFGDDVRDVMTYYGQLTSCSW